MTCVVSRRLPALARIIGFVAVLFYCSQLSAVEKPNASPKGDRPNFLVIVTDDQGWWDLSSHGNPDIETPHMDKLCGEGVEFSRFYASPVCSLTRASLFTGRYPLRTGCYDTRFGHDTLGKDEITLGNVLQSAGYDTALFGKWHQGRYMANHPNNRGFKEFFGFWQYGHVERYFYPDRLWHNQEPVDCHGHITDLFTDAAVDYIKSAKHPFCCVVTYNVPHYPFQSPAELTKKYLDKKVPLEDAEMYGMIEQCDAGIGRLLATLDEQGLAKNTVVVFLSDNGGVSKHFRAGLRGGKGNVYQGGILVPCAIRYPDHFPAGAKITSQAGVVDLLPTLAELAGAEMPHDRPIDGVSLVPLLTEGKGKSPHEHLFHNWSRNRPRDDVNWAVTGDKYKLVNGQLYDLESDPGEKHDLADKVPEITKRLRAAYVNWFKDVCKGQTYGRVPIEVGRADENPVELQTSWAELHGKNLRYTFHSYDWDVVQGWTSKGDAADWEIDVVKPGKYEVTLEYGSGRSGTGSAFSVSASDSTVHGKVEPTPTPAVFIKRQLGTLSLKPGLQLIRFEAGSTPNSELSLNRLWLKRID